MWKKSTKIPSVVIAIKLQANACCSKKPIKKTNFYIEGPFRQNDCKWLKNLTSSVLQIGFFHLLWLIRIHQHDLRKVEDSTTTICCRIAPSNPSYDQNLPFLIVQLFSIIFCEWLRKSPTYLKVTSLPSKKVFQLNAGKSR